MMLHSGALPRIYQGSAARNPHVVVNAITHVTGITVQTAVRDRMINTTLLLPGIFFFVYMSLLWLLGLRVRNAG